MRPNTRRLLRKRAMLRARARRVLLAVRHRAAAAAANATNPQRSLTLMTPPTQQQQSVQVEGEGMTEINVEELHQAVRAGHIHIVEEALEGRRRQRQQQHRGSPPAAVAEAISAVNENGDTCIHIAAKMGYAEIVSVLINNGAEASGLGSRSRTPLQLASIYGHLQAVEVLLAAGADPNVSLRDESGYEHWALSFASRMGHVEVLEALLRGGANVLQAGTRGLTALHYAAVRNQASAVHALTKAEADVEAHVDLDGGGGTPLHASAVMRCYDAALALLQNGANVDSKNAFGYSPLHGVARQAGKEGAARTADLLLRWGADENAVDRDGKRPVDILGNGRGEEEGGRRQKEIDLMRRLLERAPADRAWRRRGYVVMCREFSQKNEGRLRLQEEHQQPELLHQLLLVGETASLRRDSLLSHGRHSRRGSKSTDLENRMWSELARAEMAPETPKTSAGVHAGDVVIGPSGRSGAARFDNVESAKEDLKAVLVRLLDFPEDGVFRNTVMFL